MPKHQPQRAPRLAVRALFGLALLAVLIALPSFQSHADNAGTALQFDGYNDVVGLPETQHVMGAGWETTKTVSLWVRPAGSAAVCANNSVAWCDSIFGDRPRWWGIVRGVLNGQDRIWVWNYDGSAGSPVDLIGITYTPGVWIHVSLVHGGGLMRAYVNGVEIGSTASGVTLQPNTGALPKLYLGGVINNPTRNWTFEGAIDEVSLWSTARTPAEVLQDMTRSLSGSEPGLVAYYSMSDGGGTTLTDDGPSSWDGILLDGMSGVPSNGGGPQWIVSGAFDTGGATATPSPTPTATGLPPATSTHTPTPLPSATATPTATAMPGASATPTATATATTVASPTPTATPGAPPAGVLDTFDRANGPIGAGWSGNTGAYLIAGNQLDVAGNGSIFWNSLTFGADQEVFVSLVSIDPGTGTTSLLLKSQSSTTATAGVIRVFYSPATQTAQVWTYAPAQGWVQRGSAIPVAFSNGDRFGARARSDGWVEVLRNGVVVGSRDASAWTFSAAGGSLGIWMANATNTLLDDFGGMTIDAPMSLAAPSLSESEALLPTTEAQAVSPTATTAPAATATLAP